MERRIIALVVGLLLYAAATAALAGSLVVEDLLAPSAFALVALALFVGTALIGVSRPDRPF